MKETGRIGRLRSHRTTMADGEEHLHVLAGAAGIALHCLPTKKSDSAKLLLAAAMKSMTSVSSAWLARRLDLGSVKSVGQFICRWRFSPAVNALFESFCPMSRPDVFGFPLDRIGGGAGKSTNVFGNGGEGHAHDLQVLVEHLPPGRGIGIHTPVLTRGSADCFGKLQFKI